MVIAIQGVQEVVAETKTTVAIKDIMVVIRADVGTDVVDTIMLVEAATLVEETDQPRLACVLLKTKPASLSFIYRNSCSRRDDL